MISQQEMQNRRAVRDAYKAARETSAAAPFIVVRHHYQQIANDGPPKFLKGQETEIYADDGLDEPEYVATMAAHTRSMKADDLACAIAGDADYNVPTAHVYEVRTLCHEVAVPKANGGGRRVTSATWDITRDEFESFESEIPPRIMEKLGKYEEEVAAWIA